MTGKGFLASPEKSGHTEPQFRWSNTGRAKVPWLTWPEQSRPASLLGFWPGLSAHSSTLSTIYPAGILTAIASARLGWDSPDEKKL